MDTKVLVYAEFRRGAHHESASKLLVELAEGALPWAIPWPCVYEFLRVVTHPRVDHPLAYLRTTVRALERILQSPSLLLLHETSNHATVMRRVLEESQVTGNLVHDAHIAALCLEHGVSEFITADRDFSRFAALRVVNPFA